MIRVGVVGVSGYTGIELVKILLPHPNFEISFVATSKGGESLTSLHPSLKGVVELDVRKSDPKEIASMCDLVFLALPHKAAMNIAKDLIDLNVKVVDLSADYRLELKTYEKFYCSHQDIKNLKYSVYGLPEIYKDEIKDANLVANPGCYPTASLLGILPFCDYIDEKSSIYIDAKSGVSGAGKSPSDVKHFVKVNENIFAYNPFGHRHSPEIREKLKYVSNKEFDINFVPHLIPVTRGMLVSIYVKLKSKIDAKKVLEEFYKDCEFIRVRDEPVEIKATSGTNFCDLFVAQNGLNLFISSSIDNLLRGASSQAVVNANLMSDLNEGVGIPKIAYVP